MKGLYAENFFNSRKCILPSIKYSSQVTRLVNVCHMATKCPLNVCYMSTKCPLNVCYMSTNPLNVCYMSIKCLLSVY